MLTNVTQTTSSSSVVAAQESQNHSASSKIAESLLKVCQASEELPSSFTGRMGTDGLLLAAAGAGLSVVGSLIDSKVTTVLGHAASVAGLSMAAFSNKVQDQTMLAMQKQQSEASSAKE
ncbi:MAG: hypothetical protein ACRCSS_18300 [Shewanella sp.]